MSRPYFNTKNEKKSDEIKFMFYGRQENLNKTFPSSWAHPSPGSARCISASIRRPEGAAFLLSLVRGQDDPLLTVMQVWIVLAVRTSFQV